MQAQYNLRSPAVKRLMREAQELSEPTEQYHAQPLEDNLFEWHFTLRGPADTDFEGGIYHGRIVLPADYPMKPPSIILLTPNGRFETYKKICLSISGHHPESWQPSWSIRTALLAIIGFMPTHGNGAIGSLDYTPDERKILAKRTKNFKCEQCGEIRNILKPVTEASEKTQQEAKELAKQISFQGEKEKKASQSDGDKTSDENHPPKSDTSSAQSPSAASAAPAQQPFPNRFPMFPPMGFPGFPPGMFRPPTTSSGGNAAAQQLMMAPPFWPGIPGMPATTQSSRMPLFPPGMMLPPMGMLPQQQVQSASTTQTTDTTTTTSSLSSPARLSPNANTSSTTNATPGQSTETTSVSSNTTNVGSLTASAAQEGTNLRQRNVGNVSSQAATTPASQASASSVTTRPSATAPRATPAASRTATRRATARQSGTDAFYICTVTAMVLLAIALVILILRRLIMMKVIQFEYSFS